MCSRGAKPPSAFLYQTGFTLIELIMVLVIAGIITVMSINFISQTTSGYQDAATRQQMATLGWLASEKLSRELRNALPNSVRLNASGRCLEFMPTVAASHYISVPWMVAADRFNGVRIRGYGGGGSNERVAVYPDDPLAIYAQSNPGPVSVSTVDQVNTVSGDEIQVVLSAAHQFLASSPEKRFYITGNPVTYCFQGARLYRYREYGVQATIGAALLNEEVIVDRILAGSGGFEVTVASLTRNSVIRMFFTVTDSGSGEFQQIDQEVQVRNVP